MSLVRVTPKEDAIFAIEFTGKNKEAVRDAVSDAATVRDEDGGAIFLTSRASGAGNLLYPGQYLIIQGLNTSVYSKARFEDTFDEGATVAKKSTPKKASAKKAEGLASAPAKPSNVEPADSTSEDKDKGADPAVAKSVLQKTF